MTETNFDRLVQSRLSLAKIRPTAVNRRILAADIVEQAGLAARLGAMTDTEILDLLKAKRTKAKIVGAMSFRSTDSTVSDVARLVLLFDGLDKSQVIRIAIHEAATDQRRIAIVPQIPRQEQIDKLVQSITAFIKVFEDAKSGFLAVDIPGDQPERAALVARARAGAKAVLDQLVPRLDEARVLLAFIGGLKPLGSDGIESLKNAAEAILEVRNNGLARADREGDPTGALRDSANVYTPLIRLFYNAGLLGTTDPDEPSGPSK